MFTPGIALGIGAAVLLFWVVGAHNRLVRLRGAIAAAFVPVDAEFAARQGLLLQLADSVVAADTPALPEALRAACAQADAARARVRTHPGSAAAMTSLRLAEEILADTRARLVAEVDHDVVATPDGSADAGAGGEPGVAAAAETEATPAALPLQLAASDATLAFAQRQFNAAVQEYNVAVRQFPTWLVASLFNFRAAGAM